MQADVDARLAQMPRPAVIAVAGLADPTSISRNMPCPCNSGLRYKACHGRMTTSATPASTETLAKALAAALALARAGHARAARAGYATVLATNPDSAEAHHALALLALDMRELALADAHGMRAHELAPDDFQVLENRARIRGLRFEQGNVERVIQRLAALPYLVTNTHDTAAVAEGTPVHLISPFENPFGGTELHALELKSILDTKVAVTLWSTLPNVPSQLAARGVRTLTPHLGEHPRDGVLVFMGSWQRAPAWIRDSKPARLVVMHNVDNAPALLDLVMGLHAQAALPIHVLMPSDTHRQRSGVPGASYPTPIDIHRFVPASRHRPDNAQFTVGRMSRNEHTKFHPDEPALIRRLLALGIAVRIQGGTVLLRHFPYLQPTPGLKLLPTGAQDAVVFLQTLDAFYYRTGPHLLETAGRVVAEAMACGLPVVCARSVGFAELIEHGVDGLVFDDNDDEAALRWLTLLRDDPQRRQAMGAAARAKAEATFGPALHDRIRTLYLGNPAVSAPRMPGN
jgi:glycosyltransferase involved in cell wall biosynthesis